jgi:hypothetical protein
MKMHDFLAEALSKTLLLRYSSHSAKHVQAGERAAVYPTITTAPPKA